MIEEHLAFQGRLMEAVVGSPEWKEMARRIRTLVNGMVLQEMP